MRAFISRRALLAGTAGLVAGALAGRSRAAEDQSADQMLQELIQENQESSLDSGFDNASRNVRLPKKTLPTLSPSTAQTTEESISKYEAIVAKGGWP
jgi:L,D-transpeptidase YcbB